MLRYVSLLSITAEDTFAFPEPTEWALLTDVFITGVALASLILHAVARQISLFNAR